MDGCAIVVNYYELELEPQKTEFFRMFSRYAPRKEDQKVVKAKF